MPSFEDFGGIYKADPVYVENYGYLYKFLCKSKRGERFFYLISTKFIKNKLNGSFEEIFNALQNKDLKPINRGIGNTEKYWKEFAMERANQNPVEVAPPNPSKTKEVTEENRPATPEEVDQHIKNLYKMLDSSTSWYKIHQGMALPEDIPEESHYSGAARLDEQLSPKVVENLEPAERGYVGHGTQGVAYSIGNGLIEKYTISHDEYELAKSLFEKQKENGVVNCVAEIYEVKLIQGDPMICDEFVPSEALDFTSVAGWEIRNETIWRLRTKERCVYRIILEELIPLNKSEREMFSDIRYSFGTIFSEFVQKLKNNKEFMESKATQYDVSVKAFSEFVDKVMNFFTCLSEHRYGDIDITPYNIGHKKDGSLAILDLGSIVPMEKLAMSLPKAKEDYDQTHPDWGLGSEIVNDLMSPELAHKLTVENEREEPKSGSYGVSYLLGNGIREKITSDHKEYSNAVTLMEKQKNIGWPVAEIYSIDKLENKGQLLYRIQMESLKQLSKNDQRILRFMERRIRNISPDEREIPDAKYGVVKECRHLTQGSFDYLSDFYDLIVEFLNELNLNNLTICDILETNVGYKGNGELAIFDMGAIKSSR